MSEQVIEYDDNRKNYIDNRVKFSNIISLGWMSEKKLWTILKDKLISNQYIRINKKELMKFFKYCKDLDTIKLLYSIKKDEINSIIDPIKVSVENENEISLKFFIDYIDETTGKKLPIQLELYDNDFYITSESIYFGLIERNQQNGIDFLKNRLLTSFLISKEDEQTFRLSTIFEKHPELYPKKEDSINCDIKIPVENIIKLDSIHRDLQIRLFLTDSISYRKKFPNTIVANNYKNYSFDDYLFLYKCGYKSNDLLASPEKVDKIVNETIEAHSTCEKEKLKFLKLKLAVELTCKSFDYKYLCEYDDDFDTIEKDSVVSYVFSMLSIKGLNYLIEDSYNFQGISTFFPNVDVLHKNSNQVIEFIKLYFENDNHYTMRYKGWRYFISSIVKNCAFEVLKEIIETVPDFPLKLISDLLYSFQVECPSKMLKLIDLLKSQSDENGDVDDENSSFFSMKLFKFSNYLIGLNRYFIINSVSQFNDLKVLDDLLLPSLSRNCKAEDNDSISLFYISLSAVINSRDLLKQVVINYPYAPKELFNNYLIKSFNCFDLETVKEIIETIKVAKLEGNNKTFLFNQDIPLETKYKGIEEILNYLNEFNFSNMFNGNGVSSFFIGLFGSFSNFDELIKYCPSLKKVSFSLLQSQSSIIICEILFNQSISFNNRLKIIKYLLYEITTFTVIDYFFRDSNRDAIFDQDFRIFDHQTGRIITNELNPNDVTEIMKILLDKVDKKNHITTNEMIQILFDFLVQSKDVTFQHIEYAIELCDTNLIELCVGYFHSFYFYNLKSFKLSNLTLDHTKDIIFSKKNLYGKYFYFYDNTHGFYFIKDTPFELLAKELLNIYFQPIENGKAITYSININEPLLAISLLKENINILKDSYDIRYQSHIIIKSLFKASYKIPFQVVILELVNLDWECFSIDKLLKHSILLERIDITSFIISNYGKHIHNQMFGRDNNPYLKNCKLICEYLFENHKDVLLNSFKTDQQFIETIHNEGLIEMHNLLLKIK